MWNPRVLESVDHPNKQIFLLDVGEEFFNIPLAAVVTDSGKAGNAAGLPVVIQNIRESPVHLVGFTVLYGVAATTVFLRCNQLAFGWNEILVGGDIPFHYTLATGKPHCLKSLQANF